MGRVFCSYCGKAAHSIQADIPKSYDVTGYMCTCEKAMDEIENQLAVEELINKHRQELKTLKGSAPSVSEKVKHERAMKLMKIAEEYAAKEEWWRHESIIKDIAEGYKSK